MLQEIEVVSFDMDQTLVDFRRLLRECLQVTASFLESKTGHPFSIEQLQRTRNQVAQNYEGRVFNFLDLRREAFVASTAGFMNSKELVDEAMELFIQHRFSVTYFMPNAIETLEVLAKKYRLSVITNGNSDPSKAGIGHLFDVVIMGEDYPFRKPDPRIFELQRSQLGDCQASQIMHVGDSLQDDVEGANLAGAASVWFNPYGEKNGTDSTPSFEISHLSELTGLLRI